MALSRDQMRLVLTEFITRDLMRRPEFDLDDDLALITGGYLDSFALAELGVFVEKSFGVDIPDTELTVRNIDTLGQLMDRIQRGSGP